MRARLLLILFISSLLVGCNLNMNNQDTATPVIVTATPRNEMPIPTQNTATSLALAQVPTLSTATQAPPPTLPATTAPAASPTPQPTTPAPTATIPTATTAATATETATATATIQPSATYTIAPTLAPTRTNPPAVAPLDDGSGHTITGTGGSAGSTIEGVDSLPETLYYLAPDTGGARQVWRLQYGMSIPEQITLSPTGVKAFDVAPDGTMAYLTPAGEMVVGGVPFVLQAQVTALAYSPAGDWLAYTVYTPGAGNPAIDGLWMRNALGNPVQLEFNVYGDDPANRLYTGPILWRPDGTEVLVGHDVQDSFAYSRVNITSGAMTPLWNDSTLPLGSYSFAQWNINNNAIIVSGRGQILRVEPDSLTVQPLVTLPAGIEEAKNAQQFASGAVTFAGSGSAGSQLYLTTMNQTSPTAITDMLSSFDFVWDNYGEETLIVTYSAEGQTGTPYLRTADNVLHDLTPLLGQIAQPVWGPLFKLGDSAVVRTTATDTLNLRADATVNGQLLFQLSSGARVTILGGPRSGDGYVWWKIQTTDGISGWAVQSIADDRGLPFRTLVPIE
ncbi:MAG TPA: SH3 domain-containing protein [Aggregatilineaceae bacterium]|nr:SH3 domain-containing protein [Aggregatilineaceae bacterium]